MMEIDMTEIKEYKRKCNECGKVWHSLVSDEEKLEALMKWTVRGMFFELGNRGGFAQDQRNVQAIKSDLDKLRKCPNCGSANYTENIITYEK